MRPTRAARYGYEEMAEYIREEPLRLTRLIQIETATAVKNLPEIVRNPLIDGFIFGPVDMCGSLGLLPDYKNPRSLAVIREGIQILRDHGKSIGLSIGECSREEYDFWHDMGIHMISQGGDYNYATASAKRHVALLRPDKRA